MHGRKSFVFIGLYLIAYWRTADDRKEWAPSYGLSLRLNRHATTHVEMSWHAGRAAGVIEIGIRAKACNASI